MLGLEHPQSSYMVISSSMQEQVCSVLYSKGYQLLSISGYFDGKFDESIMAFGAESNDDLRRDALFLLGRFCEQSAIVKYIGESEAKRVFFDGSEDPMEILMYNTDSKNKSYIHEGISFSFVEKERYWTPKRQEDIRAGMVVEYMNNNQWYERVVVDPRLEWEKMYKLLLKYEKLRIPSKQDRIYS